MRKLVMMMVVVAIAAGCAGAKVKGIEDAKALEPGEHDLGDALDTKWTLKPGAIPRGLVITTGLLVPCSLVTVHLLAGGVQRGTDEWKRGVAVDVTFGVITFGEIFYYWFWDMWDKVPVQQ